MRLMHFVKSKLINKNINFKKWLIISLVLIIVGAFLSFFGVYQIVKIVTKYISVLKPGHYVRKKHETQIPFTYKLYLWNVTNPDKIAAGTEKPKLQEVGPYVFSQLKRKVETSDDKINDLYSFDLWNIYKFNPDLSAPLTGDEVVTILNVVLVPYNALYFPYKSTIVKVYLERPHLINVATESMDIIFKNPTSIFVSMTAMEFIDNGIEINCNQTAYAAKVVCGEMRRHRTLKATITDKNHLRYRWFDKLNNSIQARYTLLRGSKNAHDTGRVVAVNDLPTMKVYKQDDKCNVINGTDKLFFAPFQKKDEVVWVYSDDACKSFPLRYNSMKKMRGTKTAWKDLYLADPLMSPECECNQYSGCSIAGTLDMSHCLDIFVLGSQPHFYLADPSILQTIEGMDPKENLHSSGIYFDLLSGSPILTLERFQISWLVKRISDYHIFSSIAGDMYIPVLWYDESYSIAKEDLALVAFGRISKIVGVVNGYILMSIGVIGCVLAIYLRLYHTVSVNTEENNNAR